MVKNVLVTGAAGFVGSSLSFYLKGKGYNVIGVARDLSKNYFSLYKDITWVHGDITDSSFLERVITQYDIEQVYHLAASSIVKRGMMDPVNTYTSNVMGTVKLLDCIRRLNTNIKVVVASSDKAYGNQKTMPYDESMSLKASCPYSTSKACSDLITQSFSMSYGLNTNIVRCSNIYGPWDYNMSRIIPKSIDKCFNGEGPKVYSGVENYLREFIYITDVCNAYHIVMEKGKSGEVYNIGINECRTIKSVANVVLQEFINLGYANYKDIKVNVEEKDFPEIISQWMDGTKLKKLGWKPEVDFRDGVIKTIKWVNKIGNFKGVV